TIDTYTLVEEEFTRECSINVCINAVYAEKPLIHKIPWRDMRFSQMACSKGLDA
ncbi:hypothetical protein BBJ28_00012573, partial [Nothophytophthora sp. Chile5]